MPYYGFNFLWMFSWKPDAAPPPPDLRQLDFAAELGMNFVRIPTDYRFWIHDEDYSRPDENALAMVDKYLEACRERRLHCCLNIHRAPGYCINTKGGGPDPLWKDARMQEAFIAQWEMLSRRYAGFTSEELSFNLVNEPPCPGTRGFTREKHAALMRRAVAAIRAVDPARLVVLDGVCGGAHAMPELADLDNTVHSCRGYTPFAISHYRAPWADGRFDTPEPEYPGVVENGKCWNKETLREFYMPWRQLESKGVKVHVGEFGCFNRLSNNIALRWFADLFALWREFGWGYAMWNFVGSMGIIAHGRPGTKYENIKGFQVDRELLDLFLGGMAR